MLRKRAAKGKPTPALDDLPQLESDLMLVWEIFSNLHSQRGKRSVIAPMPGGGLSVFLEPESIKMRDIKAILDIYQIDGEFAVEIMNLILRLDDVFLVWERKKSNAKKQEGKDGKES